MKNTNVKKGLNVFNIEGKADTKTFLNGFKDRTLFVAIEQLPANIAGEKGKVTLPCTIECIDGVPSFSFVDFSNQYEGSEVMKGKSLATVQINVPFDGNTYKVSATIENEAQAHQLIHTVGQNPSSSFNCLIRRSDKAKTSASGTEFYPHYVSLVLPKLDTTQQAAAKMYAEQLV